MPQASHMRQAGSSLKGSHWRWGRTILRLSSRHLRRDPLAYRWIASDVGEPEKHLIAASLAESKAPSVGIERLDEGARVFLDLSERVDDDASNRLMIFVLKEQVRSDP
jgi:hypothetical protein